MIEKDKLALIYRLTTGYTILDDFIVDTPSEILLNESYNIYQKLIKNNRFEDWVKSSHTEAYLLRYKIWSIKYNTELEELDKTLDNCKHALFLNYGAPGKTVEFLRKQIDGINKRKHELLSKRHMLDDYTLEGYVDYFTDLFIFSNILLDKDYNKITLNELDLTRLMNKYKKLSPGIKDLKLIARTDPWRSFWDINKNIFRIIGDNQKTLTLFSNMYENVYNHPEKPADDIIADDDALDGWFIEMKKNANKEKPNMYKARLERKYPNAQEIFVSPTDRHGNFDPSMVKQINDMNDIRGNVIRKRIEKNLDDGKQVAFLDVPEFALEALNKGK